MAICVDYKVAADSMYPPLVLLREALGQTKAEHSDVEPATTESDAEPETMSDPRSGAAHKSGDANTTSATPVSLPTDAGARSDRIRVRLIEITVEIVDHIRQEIRAVDFWGNQQKQKVLRNWIIQFLDDADGIIPFDRLEYVADLLLELAKSNHTRLIA